MGTGNRSTSLPSRVIWVIAAVAACLLPGRGVIASLRPTLIQDFFQEWGSAKNYWNGLPVYGSQEKMARDYLNYQRPREEAVFNEVNAHPPTSILLALPFAFLDYRTAFLAWSLLSLTALTISLWLVARHLEIPVTVASIFPLLTLALFCSPLVQQINQGQLNLILLVLIVGTWAAARSSWLAYAGILLGAATAIKLFPGFLLLYFLLRGQWRVLLAAAGSFLCITAFTAGVLGVSAYQDYVHRVLPQVQEYRSSWINSSLMGFWCKLFDLGVKGTNVIPLGKHPFVAWAGAFTCSGILIGLLAWQIRRARSLAEQDLTFGLAVTVMLLVSPITWDHYFVMLLLPLALLWRQLPATGWARLGFWLLVIVIWLPPRLLWGFLIGVPLGDPLAWVRWMATPLQTVTVLSIPCYALLGLFALGMVALRTERGQTSKIGGAQASVGMVTEKSGTS